MATKKVAKKAAKKSVKKVAKKATAKKSAKKAPAKKAVKRSVKKASSSYTVPPVPTRSGATKRISSEPKVAERVITPAKSATNKSKSSSRTVVTIVAAIILIALLVVSRNTTKTDSNSSSNSGTTASQSAAPASSEAAPAQSESAAAAPAAPSAGHGAPQGIVAHYNANGATIFWQAPMEATGISNYQVEINSNGGAFKVASTVPASQLSMDISKSDATGWSSFRVSTIYSDGTVVGGKVFGLPGQWS